MLIKTVLNESWDEKLIVTVPRIKAFFSLTPTKMKETPSSRVVDNEQVLHETADIVAQARDEGAMDLLDIEMNRLSVE